MQMLEYYYMSDAVLVLGCKSGTRRSQFSAGRRRGWGTVASRSVCCVLLRPHSMSTARIAYPLLSPVIFRSSHRLTVVG